LLPRSEGSLIPLTGALVNVSLDVLPRVAWRLFGGIKMGIRSAIQEKVHQARTSGRTEGNGTTARHPVEGPAVPGIRTGVSVAMAGARSEAGEKMIRASLVADEWDGAIAFLSRGLKPGSGTAVTASESAPRR
jgi:hypothetical protein